MGAHDVLMQPCDASSAHLSWTGRDEAGASRLKDSTGPGRFTKDGKDGKLGFSYVK